MKLISNSIPLLGDLYSLFSSANNNYRVCVTKDLVRHVINLQMIGHRKYIS